MGVAEQCYSSPVRIDVEMKVPTSLHKGKNLIQKRFCLKANDAKKTLHLEADALKINLEAELLQTCEYKNT